MNLNRKTCTPLEKPGKRVKKQKWPTKAEVSEDVIQKQVEAYLKLLGARYIRLPNALFLWIYAQRSVPLWVKTIIAEYIAGLPDILLPKLTEQGLMMLPLELKAKNGVIGKKQKKWERVLGTKYAFSFEEAREMIDKFLKEK